MEADLRRINQRNTGEDMKIQLNYDDWQIDLRKCAVQSVQGNGLGGLGGLGVQTFPFAASLWQSNIAKENQVFFFGSRCGKYKPFSMAM